MKWNLYLFLFSLINVTMLLRSLLARFRIINTDKVKIFLILCLCICKVILSKYTGYKNWHSGEHKSNWNECSIQILKRLHKKKNPSTIISKKLKEEARTQVFSCYHPSIFLLLPSLNLSFIHFMLKKKFVNCSRSFEEICGYLLQFFDKISGFLAIKKKICRFFAIFW